MRMKKFTGIMAMLCLSAVVVTGCKAKEEKTEMEKSGVESASMSKVASETTGSDNMEVSEATKSSVKTEEASEVKPEEKAEPEKQEEVEPEKKAEEKEEVKPAEEKKAEPKKVEEKKEEVKKEEPKKAEEKKEEVKKAEPKKTEEKKEEEKEEAPKSMYKDGTFTGSGKGYEDRITTVSVTIKGDKIVSINVDSSEDDEPYISLATEEVTASIIDAQNADVSVVAGATKSSNGIMQAVADALTKAKN